MMKSVERRMLKQHYKQKRIMWMNKKTHTHTKYESIEVEIEMEGGAMNKSIESIL